jgi:signal transduction histidine kinase
MLGQFKDFIQSKNLETKSEMMEEVELVMNPDLADLLFTNLLNNAIKHNIHDGWISIRLDRAAIEIKNTGKDPQVNPELFFKRFKKSEPSSESPGLGLSIIKKVADFYGMTVLYSYAKGIHCLRIAF